MDYGTVLAIAFKDTALLVSAWIGIIWLLVAFIGGIIAVRHRKTWEGWVKHLIWIIPGGLFIAFLIAVMVMLPSRIYAIEEARISAMGGGTNSPQQSGGSSPNIDTQTVMTATATIDIFVKSNEDIQTIDIGSGGYMALVNKDNVVLLLMSDTEDHRNQLGNGTIRYRGVFNMDATSIFAKNTIGVVKQADYAQLGFITIPKGTQILENSKATVVINSNIRFDIPIPSQTVTDFTAYGVPTAIFARNIELYITNSK